MPCLGLCEWTGCPGPDGRVVVGGLVVGLALGVAVVGVPVVTLASAPGQPVHSHRPRQALENGHAISLSPRNVYIATLFKLLGWAGRPDQSGRI